MGLLGAAASAKTTKEKPKWDIVGAKLVTAKKGDTAPSVSEE